MIALGAILLLVISVFAVGLERLSLQDVDRLEIEQAAEEAAVAAAGRASLLVAANASDEAVSAALQDEAQRLAAANVERGTIRSVVTAHDSTADYLIRVEVRLSASYGGVAGPLQATATAVGFVKRPPP